MPLSQKVVRCDRLSERELAVLRDVELRELRGFFSYSTTFSMCDLHITETRIFASPRKDAAERFRWKDKSFHMLTSGDSRVFQTSVSKYELGVWKEQEGYALIVSFWKGGHHWWNIRESESICLTADEYDELRKLILDVPLLRGKLNLVSRDHDEISHRLPDCIRFTLGIIAIVSGFLIGALAYLFLFSCHRQNSGLG